MTLWYLNVFKDAEVMPLYRLAASQGITIAQYNLAVMIANGRGYTNDMGEAIRLYNLAIEHGYKNTWLLFDEDIQLLKLAATYNCVSAQIELGNHFREDSFFSTKNLFESVKFYLPAAKQGSVVAQYWLGWLYHYKQCGIECRVKAIKKAKKWYILAAEQGFPAAFNALKQIGRCKK
jgi:TPR repeat protein